MALFACLKTLQRTFKFSLVSRGSFHSLSKAPCRASLPGTRTFFKIFKKPSQTDLKIADDIPDTFLLIYRNTMSRYIWGAQLVSVVTGGMVLLGLILKHDFKTYQRNSGTLEWSKTARPTENEEFYYVAFFVVFLVLLQAVVGRTPIRIYKVPKTSKYIAVNYGHYFFGKERYSFHRGEIFQKDGLAIAPWRDLTYVIETKTSRRPIILLENCFRRPADFSIMLGEQEDPDLEDEAKSK